MAKKEHSGLRKRIDILYAMWLLKRMVRKAGGSITMTYARKTGRSGYVNDVAFVAARLLRKKGYKLTLQPQDKGKLRYNISQY